MAMPALDDPFEMKAYGPAPGDFRIGLAPIAPERWLEESSGDPAPRKDALFAAAPADVWGEAQGSRPGQAEALRLVADWLGRLPPTMDADEPPLRAAARWVDDDLCLMEKRDGDWTLTAASLCSGSFFTPAESVGKALHQLHAPVPGFNDRFLIRVARIFDHLAVESILERRNWSIVNSGELSLPRAAPVRSRVNEIRVEDAASALYLRSERQTIRRLPRTGGVLFTIRIWTESLGDVLAAPARRAAFKEAWRAAMSEPCGAVRTYKSFTVLDRLVSPLLD